MATLRAPTRRPVVVSAVHPNSGVRVWYQNQLEDAIRSMHESMLLHIAAAWKREPPRTGFAWDPAIAADASPTVTLKRAMSKWGTVWTRRLDLMAAQIAKSFAGRNQRATQQSMKAAFKRGGFTVEFAPTKKSVETYKAVIAENIALIKSIPEQYLKDVQTAVWSSVMKGADLHALTKELTSKYGVTQRRAEFIARDQNNKAKAIMENTRRQEMGLKLAEWQHSGGGKVPRPHHVAWGAQRKRYELSKGMWDSVAGRFVWPGSEPNCRCTSKTIIPGYNDD